MINPMLVSSSAPEAIDSIELCRRSWNSSNMLAGNHKNRAAIEKAFMDGFEGKITPITTEDRPFFQRVFSAEKKESYGNSWFYITQNTAGGGPENLGYKYIDDEMIVPIGIGLCPTAGSEDGLHVYLTHPLGEFKKNKLQVLSAHLLECSGKPVIVKNISQQQHDDLLRIGFQPIEQYPWHPMAPSEDDTKKGQILDIEKTLQKYATHRHNRRRTMMRISEITTVKPVSSDNAADAVSVVDEFFQAKNAKGIYLSNPSDYYNMIFHQPPGRNGVDFLAQLIYYRDIAAGFLAVEPISTLAAGLYASIALMRKEVPRLSEYLVLHSCKSLQASPAQYKRLYLGGSETDGLYDFKEKFMPVGYETRYWAVFKGNS